MGFVDSFINILKKIRYKLVRMVGKENEIDKEWETISDKILELYEKAPEKIGNKLKTLKKKANIMELEKEPEKIKEKNFFSYILGIAVLLFFGSFIVKECFVQKLFSWWIPIIFPILLFFVLGCIPYILGKKTSYERVNYLVSVIIAMFHLIIFFQISNTSIELSRGSYFISMTIESLYLGSTAYFIAFFLIREIVKPQRAIKINKDDFSYLKSNSNIESIIEIVMNSLYYHVEGIKKIASLKEEEGIVIWDIGSDMRLFLSYIDNKLSFVTLKQEGGYIKQDELCKKTQKEITYILKDMLDFSNYQGKINNNLYLNQGTAFKEYIESSWLKSIWRKHSIKILLGGIIILVVLGYYKKEELLKSTLPYLNAILVIIFTMGNLYLFFFRKKSSR